MNDELDFQFEEQTKVFELILKLMIASQTEEELSQAKDKLHKHCKYCKKMMSDEDYELHWNYMSDVIQSHWDEIENVRGKHSK